MFLVKKELNDLFRTLDVRVSDGTRKAISEAARNYARGLIQEAQENAQADGRKTLKPKDVRPEGEPQNLLEIARDDTEEQRYSYTLLTPNRTILSNNPRSLARKLEDE